MLDKIKKALEELTQPILDAALLQDALVDMLHYLCIVEGIHDLEDRKAYIEYIIRTNGGYLEKDIEEILNLIK